jgi:transposase InsO family protein
MVGPLKRAPGGFEYIYMAIDKFTKWIEYKPLVKFNATKAVEFMQDIMYWFGMPNWVITNLSSPFTTIEFRSWAQDYDINIDYASVTHPQANSQVERANGLLLARLKPRLFDELKDCRQVDIRVTQGSLGTAYSVEQSNRVLTLLLGLWLRSHLASRLDMELSQGQTVQ